MLQQTHTKKKLQKTFLASGTTFLRASFRISPAFGFEELLENFEDASHLQGVTSFQTNFAIRRYQGYFGNKMMSSLETIFRECMREREKKKHVFSICRVFQYRYQQNITTTKVIHNTDRSIR